MKINEITMKNVPPSIESYNNFLRQLQTKYGENSTKVETARQIIYSYYQFENPEEAHKIISQKLSSLDDKLYVWTMLRI